LTKGIDTPPGSIKNALKVMQEKGIRFVGIGSFIE
jgi:hypothetical protein